MWHVTVNQRSPRKMGNAESRARENSAQTTSIRSYLYTFLNYKALTRRVTQPTDVSPEKTLLFSRNTIFLQVMKSAWVTINHMKWLGICRSQQFTTTSFGHVSCIFQCSSSTPWPLLTIHLHPPHFHSPQRLLPHSPGYHFTITPFTPPFTVLPPHHTHENIDPSISLWAPCHANSSPVVTIVTTYIVFCTAME